MMIRDVAPPQDALDALDPPSLMARLRHRLAKHVPVAPFQARSAPTVSFTFDDVPVSAATTGAGLLQEHGAKGTFYVAGGLLGEQDRHWQVIAADDVVRLHAQGHEIGCHSHSHVRADRMSGAQIQADILHNRAFLKKLEPSLPLENFAYPYGYSNMAWKMRLRKYFRSSRSILPRINQGRTDAHYLHAVPLMDREIGPDHIDRAFEAASDRNGWVIFYSHDVAGRHSDYGCSPGLLRHALRAAEKFRLRVDTVSAALTRMGVRLGQLWWLVIPLT